jgi:sec-independent protein translocase protein TatB
MPAIGPLEILVIAALALIVFGPEKLPQVARTVGRFLTTLRQTAADVRSEFDLGLMDEDDDEDQPPPKAARRPHPNEVHGPPELGSDEAEPALEHSEDGGLDAAPEPDQASAVPEPAHEHPEDEGLGRNP